MTMTIRLVSTIIFIGLSETNTIGYQADDPEWAQSLSTQPQHKPSQLPQRMQQRVVELRRTWAPSGKPVSAEAIQQELQQQGIQPIPSRRTIYRILQRHDQEDI
jgi:hypothetical protein